MLTIKQALAIKPVFTLSYDTSNSLGAMLGDEPSNEYLAELIIQHHSLVDDACLAFTIECLISVDDKVVTIEQMDTSSDVHNVYANNIESLPDGSHYVWSSDIDDDLQDTLKDLIESQPIEDKPDDFIVESW